MHSSTYLVYLHWSISECTNRTCPLAKVLNLLWCTIVLWRSKEYISNIINLLLLLQAVSSTITSERLLTAVRYGGLQVVLLAMVSVSRHDGEKKHRGLTGGVVMITDVCSTIAWELPANLKPSSVLKSNSPSLFSEVSYPHPRREFKLPKREKVYNFDVMMFKRRYLKNKIKLQARSTVFWNDIRAVGLWSKETLKCDGYKIRFWIWRTLIR